MKKVFPIFLLLFAFRHFAYSQINDQAYIDSLLTEIATAKTDSQKIKLYNQILAMHLSFKPEEGLKYEQPALELAQKMNWKSGIAMIKRNTGLLYWRLGNFEEALKRDNDLLSIYQEMNDSANISDAFSRIGQDYADAGKFEQALDYFTKALQIAEAVHDTNNQASLSMLLAWVYSGLGRFPEAAKWNLLSLKLYQQIGNQYGIGIAIANLGDSYLNLENYPQALMYYFESLDAMKDDPYNLAITYLTIGDVYQKTNKPDSALMYYNRALDLSREKNDTGNIANAQQAIGKWNEHEGDYIEALKHYLIAADGYRAVSNKRDLAYALSAAGICYTRLHKYPQANTCFGEVQQLADELKSQRVSSYYLERREVLDSSLGDWKNAYFHYKIHIGQRDSITNEETKKKGLQLTMQYEFDKKETAARADQEKKDAVAAADLRRQKLLRNSFVGGFTVMLLFAGVFFAQRNRIKKGKKRSDELLLNILPEEVAEELKEKGTAEARQYDEVTVLFTDFKNFTQAAENLSAQELVNEINYCYSAFDNILSKHGIEKIKTIGDAYMCAGGLPVPNKTNAEDTVKVALDIRKFMLREKQKRETEGKKFFEIRIGLHTGPVVAGIVGIKKFAYDIWGDTVNIASRMESSGQEGKVNISGATYELVKDKFTCTYRGKIQAKNKGEIDMYFVENML